MLQLLHWPKRKSIISWKIFKCVQLPGKRWSFGRTHTTITSRTTFAAILYSLVSMASREKILAITFNPQHAFEPHTIPMLSLLKAESAKGLILNFNYQMVFHSKLYLAYLSTLIKSCSQKYKMFDYEVNYTLYHLHSVYSKQQPFEEKI